MESRAVSDGSYKINYWTAAMILYAEDKSNQLINGLPCHHLPHYHDAYRAELSGLFAITVAITVLCAYHNITEGTITIACDNDTALDRCFDIDWEVDTKAVHWDLIKSIRNLTAQLPINIIRQHVKGHKDDHLHLDQLSLIEQLNVRADTLAKAFMSDTQHVAPPLPLALPGGGWQLRLDNFTIPCNFDQRILDHCSTPDIQKVWNQRRNITSEQFSKISWNAMDKAMKAVSGGFRIFITKHVSDFSATGKQMKLRKQREHDYCPRCKANHEDSHHVVTCQAKSAHNAWIKTMKTLKHNLYNNIDTPPTLPTALIAAMNRYYCGFTTPISIHPDWDSTTKQMIRAQNTIGWKLFLEGAISSDWEGIIDHYLRSIRSKQNSLRWISCLIRKIWEVSWDMWEHRNQVLHHEQRGLELLGIPVLDNEITAEHAKGIDALMLDNEKQLFERPLHDILSSNTQLRRAWLDKAQAARTMCQVRNNTAMTCERNFMRRYLNLIPL